MAMGQQPASELGTGNGSPATPSTSERAMVMLLTADQDLTRSVLGLLDDDRYRLSLRRRPSALVGFLSDHRTDAILLDVRLPVSRSADLGRLLRDPRRDPTIPVLGLCTRAVPEDARVRAVEAGLWDVIELPTFARELTAKLDNWVSLKLAFNGIREGILVDVETGHYSPLGVKRRLRELSALAGRTGEPLSCVVFGADPALEGIEVSAAELDRAGHEFSRTLHQNIRESDVVGRVEPLKFVVLAPQTAPAGAMRLAERFTTWSVTRRIQGFLPLTFSAGVAGTDGEDEAVTERPELLFVRASRALNVARASGAAQVERVTDPAD